MKALLYERAHNLEDFATKLAEISEPTLRELDVLVDVHAVGINTGGMRISPLISSIPFLANRQNSDRTLDTSAFLGTNQETLFPDCS